MLPDEVKDYTESYQWLWFNRENYQWFRFNIMNMWVDSAYDSTVANESTENKK